MQYWLDRKNFELKEAFGYRLTGQDKRQVKQIIFEHFEYIEQEWDKVHGRRR